MPEKHTAFCEELTSHGYVLCSVYHDDYLEDEQHDYEHRLADLRAAYVRLQHLTTGELLPKTSFQAPCDDAHETSPRAVRDPTDRAARQKEHDTRLGDDTTKDDTMARADENQSVAEDESDENARVSYGPELPADQAEKEAWRRRNVYPLFGVQLHRQTFEARLLQRLTQVNHVIYSQIVIFYR